ncbi:hypothetical protein BDW71DRAFT_188117 [Aspergillus fruticulosus]
MHSSTLFLGLTILTGSLSLAADQVVTMFIPDLDDGLSLAGKVVGSESDTTTYSVTCADSVSTTCEIPNGATIIQAPSTMTILVTETGRTATVLCTHDAKSATWSLGIDGEFIVTSTEPVSSYGVTITATETGSASTSKSPVVSASATPTTLSSSTAKGAETQSTTSTNTTSGAAQETDGPDNGAMAGQPLGAAAMAVAMGVAIAML